MSTEYPGTAGHPEAQVEPEATAPRQPTRPPVIREVRQPLRFTIPDEVIDRLAGGRPGTLRRLTPIKPGRPRESLDPVVQRALEDVEKAFKDTREEDEAYLADAYLAQTEAVTASLNRKALPALTRSLLAAEGVYVALMRKAVERVVQGQTKPTHTHTGRGSHA